MMIERVACSRCGSEWSRDAMLRVGKDEICLGCAAAEIEQLRADYANLYSFFVKVDSAVEFAKEKATEAAGGGDG